jgi:hypothetical protein
MRQVWAYLRVRDSGKPGPRDPDKWRSRLVVSVANPSITLSTMWLGFAMLTTSLPSRGFSESPSRFH